MIVEWTPGEIANFLRAGGRFGPADWVKLDEDTRDAVRLINAKIREEQISEILDATMERLSPSIARPPAHYEEPEDPPPRPESEHGSPLPVNYGFPAELKG